MKEFRILFQFCHLYKRSPDMCFFGPYDMYEYPNETLTTTTIHMGHKNNKFD